MQFVSTNQLPSENDQKSMNQCEKLQRTQTQLEKVFGSSINMNHVDDDEKWCIICNKDYTS